MEIYQNYSLKELNTFRVNAKTSYFIEVNSVTDLNRAVGFANEMNIPVLLLGGGSNILFTQDFHGLTIKIKILGHEIVKEDQESVWIKFGAGEEWHSTVLYAVEKGLGGIENLSLIPGTVGAAPMQNIGAYGVELKEVFDSLEAYELESGKLKVFNLNECNFGYRLSIFKNKLKGKYVITQVVLRLNKIPKFNITYNALKTALEESKAEISIKSISDTVITVRQSKLPDPNVIGNAGSFFKNPSISARNYEDLKQKYPDIPGYSDSEGRIKLSAAWFIERCGWKGKRFNDAGVHEKHALILVNYGNASGKEIQQLAQKIQDSVKKTFGVDLEPEVNVV